MSSLIAQCASIPTGCTDIYTKRSGSCQQSGSRAGELCIRSITYGLVETAQSVHVHVPENNRHIETGWHLPNV